MKKKNNNNDSPINTVTEFADGDELNEVLDTSPATSAPKVVNEGDMNEFGTTVLESFPTLPTQVTTLAGNAPGKSSYANVTGKPSEKKLNIRTLFTPGRVAYPVVVNYVRNIWGKYGLPRSIFSSTTGLFSFQFSSIKGLDVMLENGLWFIRNNPLILKKWHSDKNLLKEDDSIVPVWVKIHGEHVTAFSDDGLSAIATKLENTGAGEKKTLKKPSQTSRGVEPTIEVSNSNPFDVLNSVDNDAVLVLILLIKIKKFEDLLYSGQAILVDNAGNPLKKVEFPYENLGQCSYASPNANASRSASTSFATLLTEDSTRKGLNFRTLITQARNKANVLVALESIREKKRNPVVNLMKKDVANVLADVELKDIIVVDMPKLIKEGFYTCTIRVEYEWKPPRCVSCGIFSHVQDECLKNIDSGVEKNLKKSSQTPRGALVGLKVGFKLAKQVYRHVSRKINVNTSINKENVVEPTKEVAVELCLRTLLHNTIAQDLREGPLNMSFEK
nr:hypothetical protein [Tanacetum cinerariifolium]